MLVVLQIFCTIRLHSTDTPTLFIEGVRFLKNLRRGDEDFLVKMGGGVSHIGRLSIKGEGVSSVAVTLIT